MVNIAQLAKPKVLYSSSTQLTPGCWLTLHQLEVDQFIESGSL